MSKVMISLPDMFLRDLDRLASAEHRSRSELVREAIRRYVSADSGSSLAQSQSTIRRAASRILRTRLRWPPGHTGASLIRHLRDTRYGAR